MGGGYFIKLSKILFDNLYFFYLTSIIGLFLIYILSKDNRLDLLLNVILLTVVSAYIIFMKYFEPMYILVLFLLMKNKLTNIFWKKENIYSFIIYTSRYT